MGMCGRAVHLRPGCFFPPGTQSGAAVLARRLPVRRAASTHPDYQTTWTTQTTQTTEHPHPSSHFSLPLLSLPPARPPLLPQNARRFALASRPRVGLRACLLAASLALQTCWQEGWPSFMHLPLARLPFPSLAPLPPLPPLPPRALAGAGGRAAQPEPKRAWHRFGIAFWRWQSIAWEAVGAGDQPPKTPL